VANHWNGWQPERTGEPVDDGPIQAVELNTSELDVLAGDPPMLLSSALLGEGFWSTSEPFSAETAMAAYLGQLAIATASGTDRIDVFDVDTVNAVYTPIGPPITPTDLVGSLAIALPDMNRPILAYVDQVGVGTEVLHVVEFDGTAWVSWASEPVIDAGELRMAFLNGSDSVYVAWTDHESGTAHARFAAVTSTGLTKLEAGDGPGSNTEAAFVIPGHFDGAPVGIWTDTTGTRSGRAARWVDGQWRDLGSAPPDVESVGVAGVWYPEIGWRDADGLHVGRFNGSPTP
jgi:hypothetical protein